MGDRVAVLDAGILQQVAPPKELYARPANVFVAGFIGSPAMNLLRARAEDGAVMLGGQRLPVPDGVSGDVIVGVRPENTTLGDGASGGLEATVVLVEELGADSYVYAHWDGPGAGADGANGADPLIARVGDGTAPQVGSRVSLVADPDKLHLFDADTGRRLN